MSSQERSTTATSHVLDRACWNALVGPHAHLAEVNGSARRYPADMSPFNAVADIANPQAWDDLQKLIGYKGTAIVIGESILAPTGWKIVKVFPGVQMTGEDVVGQEDADLVNLTNADALEMLALAARNEPGPFLPRTVELGGYLGVRVNGKLVAMAGKRLNPPGWVEISAVCTDLEQRGKGYAARLVLGVTARIIESGQRPFLHASAQNLGAIRLYEKLGFKIRTRPIFTILKPGARVIHE
jgi:predicted GNAT family acetyltransferase